MRKRMAFVGGRDSPDRRYFLVLLLGGPWAAARYLSVAPTTLWRWRTGKLPLSEKRALQLRAVALDLVSELSALAYELKSDAAAGRQRRYRDIARRTDLLAGVRPYRERLKRGP